MATAPKVWFITGMSKGFGRPLALDVTDQAAVVEPMGSEKGNIDAL